MRAPRNMCVRTLVLAVAAACVGLVTPGYADVLPNRLFVPRQGLDLDRDDEAQEAAPLPLRIAADADAATHRIVIPAALIADLADVPLRARRVSEAAATTRSVVAGLALSLAVGCGLLAFRRGRPTRTAAVVLIGLSLAGGGGACLLSTARADIPSFPAPERPRPRGPRLEVIDVATLRQGGRVLVELTADEDDEVVFVVGGKAEPQQK